jgi:hypothetical protein
MYSLDVCVSIHFCGAVSAKCAWSSSVSRLVPLSSLFLLLVVAVVDVAVVDCCVLLRQSQDNRSTSHSRNHISVPPIAPSLSTSPRADRFRGKNGPTRRLIPYPTRMTALQCGITIPGRKSLMRSSAWRKKVGNHKCIPQIAYLQEHFKHDDCMCPEQRRNPNLGFAVRSADA